ncbi:MAG: SsrA-binding protein [Spiroplasma sp.]|nr:SsrA-binding protein [Spiroplasma sp.]
MKVISKNRKAYFNYEILDRYEAGLVLTGAEIKAIRNANVNIQDSYISFLKNQAYIINMNVTNYQFSNSYQDDPLRKRKLLLHKKEILKLQHEQKTKGLVIIVLTLYLNQKQKAKLEIATARSKKLHDKRQAIKTRQLKREIKDKY